MEKNKFIYIFSDDLIFIEEAYKKYLEEHPESDWVQIL